MSDDIPEVGEEWFKRARLTTRGQPGLRPAKELSNIFEYHNCWGCRDGTLPCRQGHPNRCDIPHAKND